METDHKIAKQHKHLLNFVADIIQYIFTAELSLMFIAQGLKPWKYFNNPWQCFDFVIVALGYLPLGGMYVSVNLTMIFYHSLVCMYSLE